LSIYKDCDIRGIYQKEFNDADAYEIGRALGTVLTGKSVCVGGDVRVSTPALKKNLIAGLLDSGANVTDLKEIPTPALYFAVHVLEVDGGCQVTGSHNPPEFNGFKMVLAGDSLHGEGITALWETITTERWRSGAGAERADSSILGRYRDAIIARNRLERPVRVVVDCGNGVASLIAVQTLEAMGADVISLFCESDGTFPNHHPDPTVPANLQDLQAAVRRESAELGIAFDGDGDRIGAVDETGRILFGDQLLVIFGRDAVGRFGKGPRSSSTSSAPRSSRRRSRRRARSR
jgi:phosphomannomutase/phosphoglucomutase